MNSRSLEKIEVDLPEELNEWQFYFVETSNNAYLVEARHEDSRCVSKTGGNLEVLIESVKKELADFIEQNQKLKNE